ncbi:N2,N2-dimethylguanosine tRNA methyltransferase [Amylocystis lapponica]|nr:N2,N2-dimethylguanosine tRNA methyltransferase [Amylocystis lapponica]
MASEESLPITIPEGYTLHTENTSRILLPPNNEAFLNPVQEFNRDLSVACIRTWSELLNNEKEQRWRQGQERRARRAEGAPQAKRTKTSAGVDTVKTEEELPSGDAETTKVEAGPSGNAPQPDGALTAMSKQREYRPYKSVILEALSATGLRSIRYAKEIPLAKYVIANDLSPTAVAAMRQNVELNGLGVEEVPLESAPTGTQKADGSKARLPKVRVNESDACALMYNHRAEKDRVDVVDLDPYGTAAPFIDAAVQCVNDGGLLCVTCTDLSVLATTNYPEKCFSNYGGIPVKAEYCHEAALRLVLNTISTSAGRYGRYIQPLLSLSIDFYVRLFVRVYSSSPTGVKKAASKISTFYICSGCQSFFSQPLSRMTESVHESSGNATLHFKAHTGPTVPSKCPDCNFVLHVSGPMWSGPLHDPSFITKVLEHVEASEDKYGTSARMKGMLTVAKEELDTPFYFTPAKIAGSFHCTCPPLDDVASALLHAGHQISRSHALPGSLKTTATRSDVHDVFRSWVKLHPVKRENVSETSPTHHLLSKEPTMEANFKHHPQSVTPSSKVKLVRYQTNPTPYWGPGKKAGTGSTTNTSAKRKREQGE